MTAIFTNPAPVLVEEGEVVGDGRVRRIRIVRSMRQRSWLQRIFVVAAF
jgi:hypothetical protein